MIRCNPYHHLIVNGRLLRGDAIIAVDFREIENLRLEITLAEGKEIVEGIQAIDLLMQLRPSALENRRLRWKKGAWSLHNLIGHPLMQLLAFMKCYDLAMWVHDATVPRPTGKK